MSGCGKVMIRSMARDEIEMVWQIDRAEVIDGVYYLRDGQWILEAEHYDLAGWPPGERERYTPILYDCFDRGGTFYGAFEDGAMVGAAVLESRLIGRQKDQLQLKFLHVGRANRRQGLGRALFEKAVDKARALGATRLYVSATPAQNTIDFYRHLGCAPAQEVDAELFALEPEDIHLEYAIPR